MPSIVNGIQGRNASNNAAQEISDQGINNAHGMERSTADAISRGETGLSDALKSLDTGVGNANSSLEQKLNDALNALSGNAKDANSALTSAYNTTRSDLNPYLQVGQTGTQGVTDMLAGKWDPNTDPSYQFRMKEAQKALARSASAGGGGTQGGGYAKALNRYTQDYASTEYGKAFDRYSSLAKMGLDATNTAALANTHYGDAISANDMTVGRTAADLWQKTGSQESDNWNNWAGRRATTSLQGNQWIGETGMKGQQLANDWYMQGAKGRAAGHLGAANAWAGMLNNMQQGMTLAAMAG